MSTTMLRVFGFIIGIAGGVFCFAILGTIKGGMFPGLGVLSVIAGLIIGGAMQKFLVNRFASKGEKS